MPAEAFDVVVVGSLNLDLVASTARLPGPGETVIGSAYAEHPGGKGLNQAVAAARAGASVARVGLLGDDDAAAVLRGVVMSEGIDASSIDSVPETPSGRALIWVDESGENSIVVVPGANGDLSVDRLVVPPARVVLCQLEVPLATVTEALRSARVDGALTILDPAPAVELPPETLAACVMVVPNEHEIEIAGGVDRLHALGVDDVVITLGADGAAVHRSPATSTSSSTSFRQDVFPVDVVDTTGAGDAFRGALAARLAAGRPLDDAVRFASAAGALATTVSGAVPSLPRRDEIERLSRAGGDRSGT